MSETGNMPESDSDAPRRGGGDTGSAGGVPSGHWDLGRRGDLEMLRTAVRRGYRISDQVRAMLAAKIGVAVAEVDPSTPKGRAWLLRALETMVFSDKQGLAEVMHADAERARQEEQADAGQTWKVNITTKGNA